MRTFAYVRVDPDEQIDIRKCISIFNDSGYNIQKNRLIIEEVSVEKSISYREKFIKLVYYGLEEGDGLIIKSIDCLGSCFEEIFDIVYKIEQKKISLICMDYSKNVIQGDIKIFFLHFLKLCLEFEKLKSNRKLQLKNSKVTKNIGRPEKLNAEEKHMVVAKYKQSSSVYRLAKEFEVSRTVIQRILANETKKSKNLSNH